MCVCIYLNILYRIVIYINPSQEMHYPIIHGTNSWFSNSPQHPLASTGHYWDTLGTRTCVSWLCPRVDPQPRRSGHTRRPPGSLPRFVKPGDRSGSETPFMTLWLRCGRGSRMSRLMNWWSLNIAWTRINTDATYATICLLTTPFLQILQWKNASLRAPECGVLAAALQHPGGEHLQVQLSNKNMFFWGSPKWLVYNGT
jgi:hypothetical protein